MPEQLPWGDVLARVDWQQGEHVTLIGPTGAGKTTAALALLAERERRRGHVLTILTKPRDPVAKRLRGRGYESTRAWPPPYRRSKIILWPKQERLGQTAEQRQVVSDALDGVFADGAWCVYIDELFWLTNRLKLDAKLRDLWLQGRSLGVTLVASGQRPRNLPVEAYSSSSHLLLWQTNDDDDLKRIAGLGAASTAEVRDAVSSLDFRGHEVLWVDTRGGDLFVTKPPA